MTAHEKTLAPLLDLGDLAARRTRADQIENALRTAILLTEADAAVLLSPGPGQGRRLVLHAGSAAPALVPPHHSGSEVARVLTEECRLLVLPDLAEESRYSSCDGCPGVAAGPVLYAPLRQRDPAPGYLGVYRRCGRAPFSLADNRSMLLLSAWFGLALENLRLSSGVERLAVTEGLTEVYNARFLKAALRRELRRAGRFGQEVSLVQVELDQIDGVREEQGELRAGVTVRELASLLANRVRAFDLVARADDGGFILVLPQTGDVGANEVAERMRVAVERNEFSAGPPGTITASFGVASFPRQGTDVKALLGSVSRALAQARQRGPNCVHLLDRAA